MPRKTQETVIDGCRYRIRQLGAETGDMILFKLGRGLTMQDLSPADYTFVRNIFKDSTELEIVDTKGDGRKTWVPLSSAFDDHFAGRYSQLGQWLKFAFEANFSDFLGVVLGLVKDRAGASSLSSLMGVPGAFGESSPPSTSTSEASQS